MSGTQKSNPFTAELVHQELSLPSQEGILTAPSPTALWGAGSHGGSIFLEHAQPVCSSDAVTHRLCHPHRTWGSRQLREDVSRLDAWSVGHEGHGSEEGRPEGANAGEDERRKCK